MKKVLLAIAFVFTVTAAAWAAEPEFSADMNMRTAGQTIQSKVYYSQKKMRYEMPMGISITRMDENVTYILLPSQKIYMKQSIDPTTMAQVGAVSHGEVERVSMGKESVNGRSAEKFRIRYSEKGGDTNVYQWQDETSFPVKIEALDGSWSVEYSNVQSGHQPDSLFEVPSDYKSFETPSMPGMEGLTGQGMQGIDMESLQKMMEQMKGDSGSDNGDQNQ